MMPTRRDFLRTGGAIAAAGAALNLAHPAAAQDAHAGHAMQGTKNGSRQAIKANAAADAPASTKTRPPPMPDDSSFRPVVTLNGGSLPWRLKDGVKEVSLVAEPVRREFAPGMVVNCWGYNGRTPGPTIEAVQGDRVRILVANKLPEWTTVHWHGILVPNGMDGVGGLTQPQIPPGKTMVYEFTLKEAGTYMYHPHADEMLQMAMGMMGFFSVHP